MRRTPRIENIAGALKAENRRTDTERQYVPPQAATAAAGAQSPLAGHQYGRTVLADNSYGHFGDNVQIDSIANHFYVGEQQKDILSTLLKSLAFPQMNARMRNVAAASPATCQWLFSQDDFVTWADDAKFHEHHGFFWIRGHPGSGKSTIMKATLGWARSHWPNHIIMSYFFNARATNDMERSTLGLYRSVAYQLLSAYHPACLIFDDTFQDKVLNDEVEPWTETELRNFLIDLISTSTSMPPITFFIDALDEGFDDEIHHLVENLEEFTDHATASQLLLRICLSSRHYPHVEMMFGKSIVLEREIGHTQDIKLYIENKLRMSDNAEAKQLQEKLLARSQGIFLWAVLVIPQLNQMHRRGNDQSAMMKALDDVPLGLHDLFAQLLSLEAENSTECVYLLQWVLYSLSPLRINVLYAALRYMSEPPEDDVGFKPLPAAETQKRKLLDCSRGLVELIPRTSKTWEPNLAAFLFSVQFIHQCVRDHLLKSDLLANCADTYTDHKPREDIAHAARCHNMIAKACLEYLAHLPRSTCEMRDRLLEYPLADYAAEHWWQHLRAAKENCDENVIALAAKFLSDPRTCYIWTQIYDIESGKYQLESRAGPSNLDSALSPPVYYAACTGVPQLVHAVLISDLDLNANGGTLGSPLQAALGRWHSEVISLLLEAGADPNTDFAPSSKNTKQSTALQEAAAQGKEAVVKSLLRAGADVNRCGEKYGTALHAALLGNRPSILGHLLHTGARVNECDNNGHFALTKVAKLGHLQLLQMLLDAGADIYACDLPDHDALLEAVQAGHIKVARILLEAQARSPVKRSDSRSLALLTAIDFGRDEFAEMLIDAGAHLNFRDWEGWSPLMKSVFCGQIKMVKTLLDAGAYVSTSHSRRGTALCIAARGGFKEIVNLLLHHLKDDTELRKIHLAEALHTAVYFDRITVAAQLIKAGADVNIRIRPRWAVQTTPPRSPLFEAVKERRLPMIELLLTAGAEVHLDEIPTALSHRHYPPKYETAEVKHLLNAAVRRARMSAQASESNPLYEQD